MVALLFHKVTLPASVGVALRSVSRGVAASVKSVRRAQTFHALRWPASETVIGVVSFPATDTVASVTPRGNITGARSGVSASSFGKCARVSLHWHPPPPNNSFKPTPCRGIGHVLYATLAHVRRPATGRLNSGVRCRTHDHRQSNLDRRCRPRKICSR